MLTRPDLRSERGTALITAILILMIMLPLGLALLSVVDMQTRESGSERTRDRAFNLADSALTSAAFSLSRAWPASAASAPSNTGAAGAAAQCSTAAYGAQLGAPTNAGSATARLQPNLNASYTDSAYSGATWQINVCDDDPSGAGQTSWKDALLTRQNYDQNHNDLVWVRAQATVDHKTRALAGLVRIDTTPALSSKFGLIAGRMNADVTSAANTVLTGGLLGGLAKSLLHTSPLVAADPAADTTPPTSGVTAVRCGALDSLPSTCLAGIVGSTEALPFLNELVTGNMLVQAATPTSASDAAIAQLKQQAMSAHTYQATTPGMSYPANYASTFTSLSPPSCTWPGAAGPTTVVYIEQVGNGDDACMIDTTTNPQFEALVIAHGRVVLRGNGTLHGVVYALNQQRDTLGDAASPTREVIRIDTGAHVLGGVAADGKSAQVGIYPPRASCSDLACALFGALSIITGGLDSYNPAIQANVALINAVSVYDTAAVVPHTFRDVAGELP
jgi:Tfp pilus assembly protein PilX